MIKSFYMTEREAVYNTLKKINPHEIFELTNPRPKIESHLYFYTNQLSDAGEFLKELKTVVPIRARDKDVIIMALIERIICKEKINSLLSQYAWYYPYN